MQSGLPTGVYHPVNVSNPVSLSIRNEVISSLRWLHAYRKCAAGIQIELTLG